MKHPFAIIHKRRRQPFMFFEFPAQADNYIKKHLDNSPYFKMIDLRKWKKRKR